MNDPALSSHEQVLADYQDCVQTTYGRLPIAFVRGEGARLWDANGKSYLDWVSGGRAGNALGHCHPHVRQALERQLGTLTYVSNDFYNPWTGRLGRMLSERSGGRKPFFCNSGAEASETAIKLARKWGHARRGEGCHEILTFAGSFHGRTLGALSATGQTKFHQGFEPIVPGFRYLPWEDLDAVAAAIGPQTCAVFLEPIQGESGIFPAGPAFLTGIERLCRERDVLFMLDEVQTGFGRTGRFWAYEHYGVEPDVVTIAKALGAGFAVAACLAKPECCALVPGDHGCTFGGSPFAGAAGIAGLEALDQCDGIRNAAQMGEYLLNQFRSWSESRPAVVGVRGMGLMIGLQLEGVDAGQVVTRALEAGLVIHAVGSTILRLLPPVVLTRKEADEGLNILGRILDSAAG